jgi:hypothetical protein
MVPSATASFLAARLGVPALTLLDVGCSGGLDPAWRAFGDKLAAYGFDPAIAEIERLRAAETRPLVKYVPAFVGLPIDHPMRPRYQLLKASWSRLSAAQAQALANGAEPAPLGAISDWKEAYIPQFDGPLFGEDEAAAVAEPEGGDPTAGGRVLDDAERARQAKLMAENLWDQAELVNPDTPLVLSRFLKSNAIDDIDFIKIDIDGPDYTVLYDLAPIWQSHRVLGVLMEVNFEGSFSPHHHTFHNTDRYLRRHGFDLFDLTMRRYSSGALPSPFLYGYAAQTVKGRPLQGDALYLRDFAWSTETTVPDDYTAAKIARLVALFCLFDLHDQAAETALRFRRKLGELIDVDDLLDRLAAEVQTGDGPVLSYKAYMERFRSLDAGFFNAAGR